MTKFESIKIQAFGDTDQISSERYFVTITTLITAIFLLGLCAFHIFLGFNIAPVILASSSSIVMFGLYYFVRFQKCLQIPKVILTVLGLILLDITWYSKFLSNGPVLFFILIFAALVIWVWEGRNLVIFSEEILNELKYWEDIYQLDSTRNKYFGITDLRNNL